MCWVTTPPTNEASRWATGAYSSWTINPMRRPPTAKASSWVATCPPVTPHPTTPTSGPRRSSPGSPSSASGASVMTAGRRTAWCRPRQPRWSRRHTASATRAHQRGDRPGERECSEGPTQQLRRRRGSAVGSVSRRSAGRRRTASSAARRGRGTAGPQRMVERPDRTRRRRAAAAVSSRVDRPAAGPRWRPPSSPGRRWSARSRWPARGWAPSSSRPGRSGHEHAGVDQHGLDVERRVAAGPRRGRCETCAAISSAASISGLPASSWCAASWAMTSATTSFTRAVLGGLAVQPGRRHPKDHDDHHRHRHRPRHTGPSDSTADRDALARRLGVGRAALDHRRRQRSNRSWQHQADRRAVSAA